MSDHQGSWRARALAGGGEVGASTSVASRLGISRPSLHEYLTDRGAAGRLGATGEGRTLWCRRVGRWRGFEDGPVLLAAAKASWMLRGLTWRRGRGRVTILARSRSSGEKVGEVGSGSCIGVFRWVLADRVGSSVGGLADGGRGARRLLSDQKVCSC